MRAKDNFKFEGDLIENEEHGLYHVLLLSYGFSRSNKNGSDLIEYMHNTRPIKIVLEDSGEETSLYDPKMIIRKRVGRNFVSFVPIRSERQHDYSQFEWEWINDAKLLPLGTLKRELFIQLVVRPRILETVPPNDLLWHKMKLV